MSINRDGSQSGILVIDTGFFSALESTVRPRFFIADIWVIAVVSG